MCKNWVRAGIRIWIDIKLESRIRIRIDMKTLPIHNTATLTALRPNVSPACSYAQRNAQIAHFAVQVPVPVILQQQRTFQQRRQSCDKKTV